MMKLPAAISLLVLAMLAPTAMASCGGPGGWRLRSEIEGLTLADAEAAFEEFYADPEQDYFPLRHNKNTEDFVFDPTDGAIGLVEKSADNPAGKWTISIDTMSLTSQCVEGSRSVVAQPGGAGTPEYDVKVSGQTYLSEVAGKAYLNFRLTSCTVPSGGVSASLLNEMCNINIPTHTLTNLIRGSCALAAGVNGPNLSDCWGINIDGSV